MELDERLMNYEFNRLYSFYNVLFLNIAEKVDLARRYFYVRNEDMNNLVCYKCKVIIKNGCHEIPKQHECTATKKYKKNVPLASPCVDTYEAYWEVHLLDIPEMRLATFSSWSYTGNKEMAYQVAELANAGFFYARKPFCVECIYCQQRITVYVCEMTNCIDFQIPKHMSKINCRHSKPLQMLIDRPNQCISNLGMMIEKFRMCLLCRNYKKEIRYQPFYHVESCEECSRNLKAILSPSSLPSYKVNFNDRLSRGRRLSCRYN